MKRPNRPPPCSHDYMHDSGRKIRITRQRFGRGILVRKALVKILRCLDCDYVMYIPMPFKHLSKDKFIKYVNKGDD